MEEPTDPLTLRLIGLAASFDLPDLGPRVEEAVAVALDLVVADRATPATVAVASLAAGATLRDSGDDIRQMLNEQGATPPEPQDGEDPAYVTALWAVGLGGLSIAELSGVFYKFLPAWDKQTEVQRELVVLLDQWHNESDPEKRAPVAATIRQIAASTTGGNPT